MLPALMLFADAEKIVTQRDVDIVNLETALSEKSGEPVCISSIQFFFIFTDTIRALQAQCDEVDAARKEAVDEIENLSRMYQRCRRPLIGSLLILDVVNEVRAQLVIANNGNNANQAELKSLNGECLSLKHGFTQYLFF